MSSQEEAQEKMGPFDMALYGAILCVHYPLKVSIATYKTSKAAVVSTAALPKRSLNYALSTVTSVKRDTEKAANDTFTFTKTSISDAINLVKNTKIAAEEAVVSTTNSAANIAKNTTTLALNLTKNTATSAVDYTRNYAYYALGLLNQAKDEANHQFETKINEPKQHYEKVISDTANSVTDYTVSTATAVKANAEGNAKKVLNFVRNVSSISFDVLRHLSEDWSQNEKAPEPPKNQYEKTFARFQAAAFETERQQLKTEILKLHEEIKRAEQKNPERFKCDKQIHDLQDQLNRIHVNYTQQKQQLLAEFEKERQQLKQDLQKLNHQLVKAQHGYEQLSKKQVTGFDKERRQYQEEIQRLLKKISDLQDELSKHQEANHNEELHEENDVHDNSYVTEAIHLVEVIRKDIGHLKKKIAEFRGSEGDEDYLQINEEILRSLIKLDNVEVKGHNAIRKKKKDVFRYVQKLQDELKNKV